MEKKLTNEQLLDRADELKSEIGVLVRKINRHSGKLRYCCTVHESKTGFCVLGYEICPNSTQQTFKISVSYTSDSDKEILTRAIARLEKSRVHLAMIARCIGR